MKLVLSFGIAALYLGFAGVFGALLGLATKPAHRRPYAALTAAHGALVLAPSSIFIVGTTEWPLWTRIGLLLLAGGIALISATRPGWTPWHIWGPSFKHHYFAATMALTAVWGLGLGLVHTSPVTALVGAAAGLAGTASLYAGLRGG